MNVILNEMLDFDRIDSSSILLIKRDGARVLIKDATDKFINRCYEMLGKKISTTATKEVKSRKGKMVWTEKEINFLKKNVNESLDFLSEKLGKSQYQISHMKGKLNLIEKTYWTEEEIQYLRDNFEKDNFILSEELNRTIHSIKSKKRSMKLKKEI